MLICKEILKDIWDKMPVRPPESGGILAGKGGKVCLWEYDKGCGARGCVYRPDVNYLNFVIAGWIEEGYDFMGILHVHFGNAEHLSEGDKKYIEKIMKAMPPHINELYFPIVVQPKRKFVPYKAVRDMNGNIKIFLDD